jgi:D-glucosaminate-6-phosphate ammonia-lyase
MSIYDTLNVRTIINCTGTFTRLGGTLMAPEVTAAMVEASKHFVSLEELQFAAGTFIAEVTGAEAGYVTSGAQAGLVLSIAACITGLDPVKMDRLPNTEGWPNQVIMARVHRNSYDHAVEAAGGRIVEVGTSDRVTGSDYAAAITDQTVAILFLPWNAILFLPWNRGGISLADVVAVAHDHQIPVVVDGAGRLDEPSNLQNFIREGADLAVFSGGKFIRGPQASGFVAGRKRLISAIAWQHLDMDVTPAVWSVPRALLDVEAMPFVPRQGIGRGYKAGKEEIMGLVTALRLFLQRDHAAERETCARRLHILVDQVQGTPHLTPEFVASGPFHAGLPVARIGVDATGLGMDAFAFTRALIEGSPSIHPLERELAQGAILFNPFGLVEGDAERIASRCREIVSEHLAQVAQA